jgi:hypothetical protein
MLRSLGAARAKKHWCLQLVVSVLVSCYHQDMADVFDCMQALCVMLTRRTQVEWLQALCVPVHLMMKSSSVVRLDALACMYLVG